VTLRVLSEPTGEHDLTFDWRSVFEERSRHLSDGALTTLVDALSNAREAIQAREVSPEVLLDADLPLPLAFLVGYEWRITTRLRLRVWQRTGSSYAWVEADGVSPGTLSREARPGRAGCRHRLLREAPLQGCQALRRRALRV
jgi:hypothetical protein